MRTGAPVSSLSELAPRRQCFRSVTIFKGQALAPEQQALLDYNRAEESGACWFCVHHHRPEPATSGMKIVGGARKASAR